jgi:hypothetical protein
LVTLDLKFLPHGRHPQQQIQTSYLHGTVHVLP